MFTVSRVEINWRWGSSTPLAAQARKQFRKAHIALLLQEEAHRQDHRVQPGDEIAVVHIRLCNPVTLVPAKSCRQTAGSQAERSRPPVADS